MLIYNASERTTSRGKIVAVIQFLPEDEADMTKTGEVLAKALRRIVELETAQENYLRVEAENEQLRNELLAASRPMPSTVDADDEAILAELERTLDGQSDGHTLSVIAAADIANTSTMIENDGGSIGVDMPQIPEPPPATDPNPSDDATVLTVAPADPATFDFVSFDADATKEKIAKELTALGHQALQEFKQNTIDNVKAFTAEADRTAQRIAAYLPEAIQGGAEAKMSIFVARKSLEGYAMEQAFDLTVTQKKALGAKLMQGLDAILLSLPYGQLIRPILAVGAAAANARV